MSSSMLFSFSSAPSRCTAHRVELGLLVALAIFLPWYEVPKNLLWLAYVLAWSFNRIRSGAIGGRWDVWDSLFLAWLLTSALAGIGSSLELSRAASLGDSLRFIVLGWMIRRAGYTASDGVLVLRALAWGMLPALLFAYWELFGSEQRVWLELHSVGHVNHSALYLAIATLILQSIVIADSERRNWKFWTGLCLVGLYLVSLYIMASRAAIAAYVLGSLLCLALNHGRLFRAGAVRVALLIAFLLLGLPALLQLGDMQASWMPGGGVLRKFTGSIFSERDRLFYLGAEAWRSAPWTGIGIDGFGAANVEQVCAWRATRLAEQGPCPRDIYFAAPHAHNLWLNTLVERGVLGLAGLLAIFSACFVSFRRAVASSEGSLLRLVAISTWFVIVFGGLLNTTLHHETALLAFLVLGMWLGLRPPAGGGHQLGLGDMRILVAVGLVLVLSLVGLWAYVATISTAPNATLQPTPDDLAEQERLAVERRRALIEARVQKLSDGRTDRTALGLAGFQVDAQFAQAAGPIPEYLGQLKFSKQGGWIHIDFPAVSKAACMALLENAGTVRGVRRAAVSGDVADELKVPIGRAEFERHCNRDDRRPRFIAELAAWLPSGTP